MNCKRKVLLKGKGRRHKKNENCDNVRYEWDEILARTVGVAVGRRSGARLATTLLDHYFHHSWHERSALQSVAVRRSTRNDVSGHYFHCFFSLPFFPPFPPLSPFSKKECSDWKTYLAKVDRSGQKQRCRPLSRPCRPFWGPLAAILDFWGSHRRNDWIKKLI